MVTCDGMEKATYQLLCLLQALDTHFWTMVTNAVTVTASEPVMTFRVLPMTINLSRLTKGTMNVNASHERTLKASIIYQIQSIRGTTVNFS